MTREEFTLLPEMLLIMTYSYKLRRLKIVLLTHHREKLVQHI